MACTKETVKSSGLNIWSSEAATGSAPVVDIIAVQGLGADPDWTWVKKVPSPSAERSKRFMDKVQPWKGKKQQGKGGEDGITKVMWIRDLLVPIFKNVRIATYYYKSDWRDRGVKTSLRECANSFLNELLHYRQQENERQRPIILIGHSLGCVVIQQALVFAASSRHFHDLGLSVAGIIFLGAPLQGSNAARWGMWLAQALQYDSTMLRLLEKNSQPLFDVARDFSDCRIEWDLVCFYETQDAKYGLLKVQTVSQQSATRLGKRMIPLETDHSGLNKFSGKDDENFKLVLPEIRRMVKDGPSIVAERYRARDTGAGQQGNVYGTCEGSPLEQADAWIRNNHYTQERLKIERLSGDELSMDQCYVNLAIIEQPGRDAARSEGESDKEDTLPYSSPFSLSAQLKVETPPKNIQVELLTLFNLRKGPDGKTIQPRRILIRGQAGVGKTTLCKKIVHDFMHGIWKALFDRILWVPLQTLKRKPDKGYNLQGLFLRDFFSNTPNRENLAKELERALDTTKFSRTLFVLDGLDEVSEGLGKENEMHQFLKFLLEQPNVIITSRPSAKLPDNLHADLELETIGFYLDQLKVYVEKTFIDPDTGKTDSRMVGEVQSFLQRHQLMQSLVRIPIQLDALCYTWSEGSRSERVPETMTQLYEAIELKLWKKDICRKGRRNGQSIQNARDRSEIERWVKTEMSLLEFFAFSGLCSNVINFSSTHRDMIYRQFNSSQTVSLSEDNPFDDTLATLSFLRTSDPSSENRSTTYHFLHLTFQEYLAARYFVRQWTSEQELNCLDLSSRKNERINAEDYLGKEKYNARYDIFWRFVAGLLQAEGGNIQLCRLFGIIEEKPRDLLGPVHQRLVMHCLSEVDPSQEISEFKGLQKHLEGQLKQWLLFECNFKFNKKGYSQLAAEMEFPEQILKDILQKESQDVKMKILSSLNARPRIPPAIMRLVASYLGDDVSISLKKEALAVFHRLHEGIPEEIVQAMAALLKDPHYAVRSAAAQALGGQSALPDEIVQDIAALLKDPHYAVRSAAAQVLGGKSALPDKVVQAVAALLKDPDYDVRSAAAQVLSGQSALADERFYYFLLKLDSQSFTNLYGVWLRRSFSDHLTWYIKGKNYSISMPEGGRIVSFNQLKSAVQEAQAFLKVPLLKELQ